MSAQLDYTKQAVKNQLYVYGVRAEDVTDDQVFEAIRRLENEIQGLKNIKTQSKAITAKIKALETEIDTLVFVIDDRLSKTAE